MSLVIYNTKEKAESRLNQITQDAIEAGFIETGDIYDYLIYHPTEDLAAIEVVVEGGIYVMALPIPKRDFSIFFTAMELARAVDILPDGWTIE